MSSLPPGPPKAIENDVFYVRALGKVSSDPSAPWYSATPIGKHTLNDKVKNMCNMAWLALWETKQTTAYEPQEQHKCMRVVCRRSLFRREWDTAPSKHFEYTSDQMQVNIRSCQESFLIHNATHINTPRRTRCFTCTSHPWNKRRALPSLHQDYRFKTFMDARLVLHKLHLLSPCSRSISLIFLKRS